MKFNRVHLLLLPCLIFLSPLRADDLSDNFTANLTDQNLDVLAKDLGAAVGAGSFHHGKALGFPLGFDVGAHVVVVGAQSDNAILRDNGSAVAAAYGQAELGLPAKINLIVRGGKLLDANVLGGGVRVGLFTSDLPALPSISVSALYGKASHDYFDMTTYSGNVALSFNVPFIDPYIGAGYDTSKLEPTALAFSGAPGSVSRSLEGKASGYRAELGINLHMIPFTYLNLAAGLANGEKLYHAGAGVRF